MKKIFKKTITLFTVLAVIAGMLVMPSAVSAEEGIIVIYENDFENYTGGAINATTADGGTLVISGGEGKADAELGRGIEPGGSAITYTAPEGGITSGKLYISYDVRNDAQTENVVDLTDVAAGNQPDAVARMRVRFNNPGGNNMRALLYMLDVAEGQTDFAYTSGFYGTAASLSKGALNAASKTEYEMGKTHNVQIVMDVAGAGSGKVAIYIDGTLMPNLATPANNVSTTVGSFYIEMGAEAVDYIDNLRISYMKDTTFTAEMKKIDGNKYTFGFSEGMSIDTSIEDIKLVNTVTGEEAPITVTSETPRQLTVETESELPAGTEYELVMPENFKNVCGYALADLILFTTLDEGMYVSKIRLVDRAGNEHLLKDRTTEHTNTIRLYFSGDVLDIDGILVKDNEGTELDYTSSIDGNVVELMLDEYLMGSTEHTISVPDSDTDSEYSYSFTTGEGRVGILDFGFTKGGEEISLSDVEIGDTIVLTAEIIKTKKEQADIYLSYSKWQGRLMNDFDFIDLSLDESETYKKETLEIDIESTDDISKLNIRGFLWRGLDATNPITEFVEL